MKRVSGVWLLEGEHAVQADIFNRGTVHRTYLEYFENGSLDSWIKRYRKAYVSDEGKGGEGLDRDERGWADVYV